MRHRFRSKVDWWLPAAAIVAGGLPILIGILSQSIPLLAGCLTILFVMVCVLPLFSISYIIDGKQLEVRCFYIMKESFSIDKIVRIEKSNTILSSPAASLDRMRLTFSDGKTLVISPANRKGFIDTLKTINPKIQSS